ncbi:hypothetical protein F511_43298 [Dorcoceras hygrometricum]|uniref:Uncharacterized protein n=1 Tax=Dorcoceras hygrometricum TaxID=472368 RepID=A0A2Z7BLL7_9LAMI|nr:hypothetical protein F511_43298 [Dorcoceras hygrometricum]
MQQTASRTVHDRIREVLSLQGIGTHFQELPKEETDCWSENRIKRSAAAHLKDFRKFCALLHQTGGAIPLVLEHIKAHQKSTGDRSAVSLSTGYFALLLKLQILRLDILRLDASACDWIHSNSWFKEALDWMCCCLRLVVQMVRSNACDWFCDWLSTQRASAESFVNSTLRQESSSSLYFSSRLLKSCSSWFTSLFSACSWLSSFQLIYCAPAGSTWPPPDYEQLIQLWTSPLLIQLPIP